MASSLPDDLLHMICEQLWEQRDFDTLYHCTRAGKQLAVPALASIYRWDQSGFISIWFHVLTVLSMHDVAPITSARSDDFEETTQGKTQQESKAQVLSKRSSMWRAIVLSSMNMTLFPYSKYIRTLRLQDLEDLLDLLNDPKAGKLRAWVSKFQALMNNQI